MKSEQVQRLGFFRRLLACLVWSGTILGSGPSSCDRVMESVDDMTSSDSSVRKHPSALTREPEIRVRVGRALSEAEISGPRNFVVRGVSGGKVPAGGSTVSAPVRIQSGDQGIVLIDAEGNKRPLGFGVDVELVPSDGTPDGAADLPAASLTLNGCQYPGFATIRAHWSEDVKVFDVAMTMPIETYIPGVLSKELIRDWPRQAFEAQAVAARTYALFERQRARAEGKVVDVEDSSSDQVFGGTTQQFVAVEAARATRGMVLTENGTLIRAYFSSQCGGRPASAGEAWPSRVDRAFNRAGPLQAHKRDVYCQRSPLYRWNVIRNRGDCTARLRTWGKSHGNGIANIAGLRSVEVKDRNAVERPNRYTIRDDQGNEFSLSAEELREALNWPAPALKPVTRENRLNSGDVEVRVFADEVRIGGRGFGHGVGMCQWCAKGMAETGMDWRSMVEKFYHGVEVCKLY